MTRREMGDTGTKVLHVIATPRGLASNTARVSSWSRTVRGAGSLLGVALLALSALGAPTGARAGGVIYVTTTSQSIDTDGECSLEEAIYAANADSNTAPNPLGYGADITTGCAPGSGDDVIYLPAGADFPVSYPMTDYINLMGPTATPMITSTIDIEAQGATIHRVGGNLMRAFAVTAAGALTLHEVDVKGFAIQGGNGGEGGGGGGMGAGGAVYVQGGYLGVGWSTFEGNSAHGGDGGLTFGFDQGGGGGGISGNGGGGDGVGGGGGGGSQGDGAAARYNIDDDNISYGGGGGGRLTSAIGTDGGIPCGGNGGVGGYGLGDDGDDAGCPGGGGGGGAGSTDVLPGEGGSGDYGGGGGGAGEDTDGGDGGFGGGGGAGGNGGDFCGCVGGDGGFGGGGGAGLAFTVVGRGQGGMFGGDGSNDGGGGGGGAGLGGAIFGNQARIEIQNSTFTGNSATRGHSEKCVISDCSGAAKNGRGAGGAIFAKDSSVHVDGATIAGNATGEFNVDPNTGDVLNGMGGGGIVVYGDSASFRLRNSILANNGPYECYTRGAVSVTGTSHNIITSDAPNTAGDARCVGVTYSIDPQLGALQLNAPGKTPTMAIPGDSSAIDAADPANAPVDDQRGVIRGPLPDIGAFEFTERPPVATIALATASPDGSNGWYVSPVPVTVGATDADNTVAAVRCALDPASAPATFWDLPDAPCAIGTVSTDGTHIVYGAGIDTEGNASEVASLTFKIDRTAPSLAPTLSSTTVTLGQTGVTASPHATDATSGVASASCDPVDTSTAGKHTLQCTATDVAGNSASALIDYVVGYRILGFFSPVPGSKWSAGQTVPVKIALGNAAGVRISDAVAAQLAGQCAVTFTVSGAQSKQPQCLKYDAASHQFIYTWKIEKRPLGPATITVSISYAGTTITTQLSEQITIVKS